MTTRTVKNIVDSFFKDPFGFLLGVKPLTESSTPLTGDVNAVDTLQEDLKRKEEKKEQLKSLIAQRIIDISQGEHPKFYCHPVSGTVRATIGRNVRVDDNVKIGNNSKVGGYSRLVGKCSIGKDVTIGVLCAVGPNVHLPDGFSLPSGHQAHLDAQGHLVVEPMTGKTMIAVCLPENENTLDSLDIRFLALNLGMLNSKSN